MGPPITPALALYGRYPPLTAPLALYGRYEKFKELTRGPRPLTAPLALYGRYELRLRNACFAVTDRAIDERLRCLEPSEQTATRTVHLS